MPIVFARALPKFALLVPLEHPLRLDDDAVVKLDVTYSAPDEQGVREVVTQRIAELAGARVLSLAHVAHESRGAVMLRDTKMPRLGADGRFRLPPFDPVDGLLIFGPAR